MTTGASNGSLEWFRNNPRVWSAGDGLSPDPEAWSKELDLDLVPRFRKELARERVPVGVERAPGVTMLAVTGQQSSFRSITIQAGLRRDAEVQLTSL